MPQPPDSAPADELAHLRARVAQLEQLHAQTNGHPFSEQRYRVLADSMPQMVWATDRNGYHLYYNRRWYEYTGLSEADSLGFGFANALHPDDKERTLRRWERAWRDGESYEIEYRFRRYDGVYHWFIGRAMPVRDASGTIIEWVGTCTEIDEQRRAREALALVAEASALLASSLDYKETLAQVARIAVPAIADWCALDILEPDGSIQRLAAAHADPARVALAEELHRRYPHQPDAPTGVPAVIRTGRPEIVPAVTAEMIAAIPDDELRGIIATLGLRSAMVLPLTTHGHTLGALTLMTAESGRHFTEADQRLAEDLCRRAAAAIEHARLYSELRQFRATLDRTHDCVFMFDAETLHFFYVNQGAIDQVGYPAEELLNLTPLAIKPRFDEASFRAMLAPLIAGEVPLHTFETVHRHKAGHEIPVEVSLQYVTPPDDDPRFVAVVRDITERKRVDAALRASEQRYRALADSMPLLVWIADARGGLIGANEPWERYTGYAVGDLGPDRWPAIVHPDDIAPTTERWNASLATGVPFEIEQRVRRHDGTFRWHLVRARPVRDDTGQIAYWVGTNTDIDEQKRNESALRHQSEALARLTRQLEERNRELDQFAYITSHDLKAPLRGIANLAQWIEEDLGEHATTEIRQQLELLRGRAHRMEALIDGILQYSRVGRVGDTPGSVDVGALLDEVIDLLAPAPDVTIQIQPELPVLYTERLPLRQVFHNLIGNALKHGGPAVQINISYRADGPWYAFTVADNGPGIAPRYHERIFGIFQTLASRDRVEGSGLGLALVRKIVEHRGGRVTLTSEPGHGAAFTFTWPREEPHS